MDAALVTKMRGTEQSHEGWIKVGWWFVPPYGASGFGRMLSPDCARRCGVHPGLFSFAPSGRGTGA